MNYRIAIAIIGSKSVIMIGAFICEPDADGEGVALADWDAAALFTLETTWFDAADEDAIIDSVVAAADEANCMPVTELGPAVVVERTMFVDAAWAADSVTPAAAEETPGQPATQFSKQVVSLPHAVTQEFVLVTR